MTESKIFLFVCNTNLVAFTYVIRYDVFRSVSNFTRTIMISYAILTKLQKFSVKGLLIYGIHGVARKKLIIFSQS